MEYLENEVLGLKRPVSTTLLSLTQKFPLKEAGSLLNEFWEKYKKDLDAAYKCREVDGNRTRIRILSQAEARDQKGEIYIVSVANAADPAIIAEIASKCRDLQLGASIEDLRPTGIIANPLLESEFSVSSQSLFGPVSKKPSNPPSVSKPVKTEAKPVKAEPKPAKDEAKPVSNEAHKPASGQALKKEPPVKKPKIEPQRAKPTEKVGAKSSFPFQKVDKATALKTTAFDKRPLSKPVSEKVVVANDNENDDESDDEMRDEPNPEVRENEMKNLENLFDEEHMAVDETEDKNVEEQNLNDEEPHEQEMQELEEPRDQDPHEEDAPSPEPLSKAFIDPQTGKRMCRLKKTVKVPLEEDEEGFTVMGDKMIDVLIEVDGNGKPIAGGLEREASPESLASETTETGPAQPAAQTGPTPKAKAQPEPKSKPMETKNKQSKPANKKQGSLMSFFSVKKK